VSDTTVTVTLTNDERWALDSAAVMAIERRPIPAHWFKTSHLERNLATASAKLRSATPTDVHWRARAEAAEAFRADAPWEEIAYIANAIDDHPVYEQACAVIHAWLAANAPQGTGE
jgi:hypothetical protein